jgi:hypothetical protein
VYVIWLNDTDRIDLAIMALPDITLCLGEEAIGFFICRYINCRSKAWVFGRSLTMIVGSNPTGGMDVCVVLDVWTVA